MAILQIAIDAKNRFAKLSPNFMLKIENYYFRIILIIHNSDSKYSEI